MVVRERPHVLDPEPERDRPFCIVGEGLAARPAGRVVLEGNRGHLAGVELNVVRDEEDRRLPRLRARFGEVRDVDDRARAAVASNRSAPP